VEGVVGEEALVEGAEAEEELGAFSGDFVGGLVRWLEEGGGCG
jgi:hypothetical protein